MRLKFRKILLPFVLASSSLLTLSAQWRILNSQTQANLLSVDVRGQAVWASGEDGTVVQSADAGQTWRTCTQIPQAPRLSSIVAVSDATAVVISSGKGQASKAYRTIDGCKTWQVAFENPEESGSFDVLRRVTGQQIYLLGEPVAGKFVMYLSQDGGSKWFVTDDNGLEATPGETARGTALVANGPFLYFGTKDSLHPRLHFTQAKCAEASKGDSCPVVWNTSRVPTESALLKAIATRNTSDPSGNIVALILGIAVSENAAVWSIAANSGSQWTMPSSFPLTQPAAAGFVPDKQIWVAVGNDGTAISDSIGKHWSKVSASGSTHDTGWTAMALPYAVGANGQIGMLDSSRLR